MTNEQSVALKLKADHLIDLWHEFCEKHTELYEYTCDEYMHLLASDIDQLNITLSETKVLLAEINELDKHRKEMTTEVLTLLGVESGPQKLSYLLSCLKDTDEKVAAGHIEKLNLVLLDIIGKIQEQNKKNQIFLNKAILSLKELKESFNGKTQYKTYSATGMARR